MSALTTRLRRALPRMTRRGAAAGAVVVVLLAALIGWPALPERHSWTAVDQRLTVLSGPSGTEPVDLDTRLCLPSGDDKAPAVLLGHGFGGTKNSVRDDAESLADR